VAPACFLLVPLEVATRPTVDFPRAAR